jgi:hypothetical protein
MPLRWRDLLGVPTYYSRTVMTQSQTFLDRWSVWPLYCFFWDDVIGRSRGTRFVYFPAAKPFSIAAVFSAVTSLLFVTTAANGRFSRLIPISVKISSYLSNLHINDYLTLRLEAGGKAFLLDKKAMTREELRVVNGEWSYDASDHWQSIFDLDATTSGGEETGWLTAATVGSSHARAASHLGYRLKGNPCPGWIHGFLLRPWSGCNSGFCYAAMMSVRSLPDYSGTNRSGTVRNELCVVGL